MPGTSTVGESLLIVLMTYSICPAYPKKKAE